MDKGLNIRQYFSYELEEDNMNSIVSDQQNNLGIKLEDPIPYDEYAKIQTDLINMKQIICELNTMMNNHNTLKL